MTGNNWTCFLFDTAALTIRYISDQRWRAQVGTNPGSSPPVDHDRASSEDIFRGKLAREATLIEKDSYELRECRGTLGTRAGGLSGSKMTKGAKAG
jgi:hypothetical protein